MPLPSASRLPDGWAAAPGAFEEAEPGLGAEAPGLGGSPPAAAVPSPAPPPQQGVSFARITKMGFAATGPALAASAGSPPGVSTEPAPTPAEAGSGGPSTAAPPALRGAWGAKAAGGSGGAGSGGGGGDSPGLAMGGLGQAFAQLGVQQAQQAQQQQEPSSSKGKGKKGKQVLLLSGAQRRY